MANVGECFQNHCDEEGMVTKAGLIAVLEDVFNGTEIMPTVFEVQDYWRRQELEDDAMVGLESAEELVKEISDQPDRKQHLQNILTEAFKKFDKNNDNLIDKDELTEILKDNNGAAGFDTDLDEDFIQQSITLLDTNKDGKLSIDEIINMLIRAEPTGITI